MELSAAVSATAACLHTEVGDNYLRSLKMLEIGIVHMSCPSSIILGGRVSVCEAFTRVPTPPVAVAACSY